MKTDLSIINDIVIPAHELEITASRASGSGGQHVNKSNTRITVRWNVLQSHALSDEQKERVMQKLHPHVTHEGDYIVHNSESRSQHINKKHALMHLAQEVRKALFVPKKRMATRVSKSAQQARLQSKAQRSTIKKMRGKKIQED